MKRAFISAFPLTALVLSGCATAAVPVVEGGADEFRKMLSRAERLDESLPVSEEEYARLAREMDALLTNAPSLKGLSKNRDAARRYAGRFPVITLSLTVKEPAEKLYTATGFASPVTLSFRQNMSWSSLPYRIEVAGSDALLLDDNTSRLIFNREKASAYEKKIRITRASFNGAENVLAFRCAYYAEEILAVLGRHFGVPVPGRVAVTPEKYRLRTAVSAQNRLYEEYAGRALDGKLSSVAGGRDFSVEVTAAANGQFTIGGTLDGKDFDLLYGHPNSVSSNGIWSSLATVKIDDRVYALRDVPNRGTRKTRGGAIVTIYDIDSEGVSVTQRLRPEMADGVIKTFIELTAENRGDRQRAIGFRLLLDTWAGENDGVPFLLPAGRSRRVETEELEFTPSDTSIWQTFDPSRSGKSGDGPLVHLQNYLIGKDLVPPDRIAFAAWSRAYESPWDYSVHPGTRIAGDSAVILWWDPVAVPPKKSLQAATQFGAIMQKSEPVVFAVDRETNTYYAVLTWFNDTDERVSVKYSMKLDRGQLMLHDREGMEGPVEPGETFVKSIPFQVNAPGDVVLEITEKAGTPRIYRFPLSIQAPWMKTAMFPLVRPGTVIPLSYFLHKQVKLYAVLRADDGSVLRKILLKRAPWNGGFRYSGRFLVSADLKGRVYVEIVTPVPAAVAVGDAVIDRESLVIAPKRLSVKEERQPEAGSVEIYFPAGSAAIGRAEARKLESLRVREGDTVSVSGFSSLPGTARGNLLVSRLRALSVRTVLAKKHPAAQFVVRFYGSNHPGYSNRTSQGRKLNQRVLVKVESR